MSKGQTKSIKKDTLTKKDIKEIADKLGWETGEVEEALQKLSEEKSVIVKNWKKFFRICLNYRDSSKRRSEIQKYLIEENINSDLLEIMCELCLSPDPCFFVLAAFNLSELKNTEKRPGVKDIYQKEWATLKGLKSFFQQSKVGEEYIKHVIEEFDGTVNARELNDHFAFLLLRRRSKQGVDTDSLMSDVAERMGYATFTLSYFSDLARQYSRDPMLRKKARELTRALDKAILWQSTEKR
jgi:hypothetical protein